MSSDRYPRPALRRLRVYAFDPQASVSLSTAVINDSIVELPWESRWETAIGKGPANEYVEVIDVDPASGLFYDPVDLNDPLLLAQNGLAPSEGRPQFHQQMVFAVAMRTIRTFERALGRPVLWARDKALNAKVHEGIASDVELNFTRTLRIYPHAIRERNAYYSPEKRALLFGYFRPEGDGALATEVSWVFTCLSQDIVAHETTHAILHGMQQRSIDPSNVDSLAFHEGFADVVALLQHFDARDVVAHLLARSGGSLRTPTLLTGLAAQFGTATGKKGALRYALLDLLKVDAEIKAKSAAETRPARPAAGAGATDAALRDAVAFLLKREGAEQRRPPDGQTLPMELGNAVALLAATPEVHARGGFLVAAVFDAFVTIFETRSEDLFRLAGCKRGSLDLPPGLIARLAVEAARSAEQVLRMCVRALDYVPPVDMHFGEYLRAIITADTDLVPDDPMRYRVAFCEAFRKWGIRVPGCISMVPDSLLWDAPDLAAIELSPAEQTCLNRDYNKLPLQEALDSGFRQLLGAVQLAVSFADDIHLTRGRDEIASFATFPTNDTGSESEVRGTVEPERNLRDLAMKIVLRNQRVIHAWFDARTEIDGVWDKLLGLRLKNMTAAEGLGSLTFKPPDPLAKAGLRQPLFEVNSARISRRIGPDGTELHLLIAEVTQRRRGYWNLNEQKAADAGDYAGIGPERMDVPDFWFRGGATLHVDLRDGKLLRIIRKRIDSEDRRAAEVAFRTGDDSGTVAAVASDNEPFAFMHAAEADERNEQALDIAE